MSGVTASEPCVVASSAAANELALAKSGAAPPAVSRLDYIDGLRALAAFWVLVHHIIETAPPERAMRSPLGRALLGSLFFGQFPVMVFLMLSGFCLYYPFVRKNPPYPPFTMTYAGYLKRRWTRIAPPFLFAGALCLVLDMIPGLQIGRWSIVGPINPGVVVSHLLFVHNLFPAYATKIDYPMWSVGLEWQLYLLFPAMMWGFRRVGALPSLALTLLVAAVIRGTYRHLPGGLGAALHDGPFSYLEIFGAGMLAAVLTVQRRRLVPNAVLACVIVGGLAVVRVGSGNGLVHDLATSAACFATLLLATDPDSRLSRALSARWLVWLGVFSYSIYLVHAPLVHLCWFGLRPLALSPDVTFAVLTLVCVPPIIALAYAFHLVFERPFMRMKPVAPKQS